MDFIRKFKDLFYGATVGLVKQYQEKTLELLKIQAVSMYVKGIRSLRKQLIWAILSLVALMMIAVGLLVVPIAVIAFSPLSSNAKFWSIVAFGVVYFAVPVIGLSCIFSEKKWLKYTMAEEWMSQVTNGK